MCAVRNGILVLFLLLECSQSQGATIALREHDRLFTVRVEDKLEPGDLTTIKKLLAQARREHKTVVALELGSWGGDADTGMAIADYVRLKRMKVVIDGTCTSACSYPALVALGAGRLAVRNTAVLGVHQVFDNGTHDPDVPWTRRAANTLRKWGAPEIPLADMVATTPSGMRYYYPEELAEMGAIMLDEPASWWPW